MSASFGYKSEKAIKMLCEYMPDSENLIKPTLFHCIRVGVYLYNNEYPEDIIIAGIMHDALEDTHLTEKELTEAFNQNVTDMVKANTKDKSIKDQDQRIKELIRRCALNGENALIVKAADILDNWNYYNKIDDAAEMDYCRKNALALFEALPENYKAPIFEKIKRILN